MASPGFNTPTELAAHLRQMVDDEEWIARTVAIQFPTMRLAVTREQQERRRIYELDRKQAQTRKLQRDEPGLPCDQSYAKHMQFASSQLVNALWREHRPILQRLGAHL